MKRAERRAALARMKAVAARVYAGCGGKAVKYANHLAACSCHGCGNRRRYDGPTRRERQTTGE